MPPIELGPTRALAGIEAGTARTVAAGGARTANTVATPATPAAPNTAGSAATAMVASSGALNPGTAPVDSDRVAVIRKAIEEGTYPVLPTTVADAMIAAGLLLRSGK